MMFLFTYKVFYTKIYFKWKMKKIKMVSAEEEEIYMACCGSSYRSTNSSYIGSYFIKSIDTLVWVWWHIPLITALRRQRQMNLLVQDQLGWHSEFQNSLRCTGRPWLKNKKRICFFSYLIVLIPSVRWAPESACGHLSRLHKWGGKTHPLLEVPIPDWNLWAYKSGALTIWAQTHKC